jgi:hypothetical protein
MSSGKDFIPSNDAQFNEWQSTLMQYLGATGLMVKWNIPQVDYESLFAPQAAWTISFNAYVPAGSRSPAVIMAKNEDRKAYEAVLRTFIRSFITTNPLVLDLDRLKMGLPVHKTTRTPAPDPTTVPEATITLPSPAVVEIHFQDSGAEHKKKPDGVHGVEIGWAILDTIPTRWDELIHSSFDTHTPLRLTFENDRRGKTLYYALRWENTRGVKGPWSEIYNIIIP